MEINRILYEILLHVEWVEENDEVLKKIINRYEVPYFKLFSLANFRRSNSIFDVKSLALHDLPWKLAVSLDGKVATILQDTHFEIRKAEDGYVSIVGKGSFQPDEKPQLRRMAWSPDNFLLAIARGCGIVHVYAFSNTWSIICTIKHKNANTTFNPVIGLTFLSTKFKTTKWSNELLIVYVNGDVRSILLSDLNPSEFEENIIYSLSPFHRNGISCCLYDQNHHILAIAGPHLEGEVGVSVWRILNDYPYLELSYDTDSKHRNTKGWVNYFYSQVRSQPVILTLRMKLSPDGKTVGCIRSNGDLSFWSWPGMRLIKMWPLYEQPHYNIKQSEKADYDEHSFFPVELDWWSDNEVVIVRKCGAVSVCNVSTLTNELGGDIPEFFHGPPQIISINSSPSSTPTRRPAILALECEAKAPNTRRTSFVDSSQMDSQLIDENEEDFVSMIGTSFQALLYVVTDMDRFQPVMKAPKLVHKTYRLRGMKSITPAEQYIRKIDNNEFDEALALAKQYNLDCDLVYQRLWRNSSVSLFTIENYLDKVSKVQWVVNECVQRVPDCAQAAHELLKFGLNLTEKHLENVRNTNKTMDNLTSNEIHLIKVRLQLLSYLDNLYLYEKRIGSAKKYNGIEYGELRQLSALNTAVKFARNCKPDAVDILLTFRAEKTLKHWLPILSNFPETFCPSSYKFLIPKIVKNSVVTWQSQLLRSPDWVEDEKFSKFFQSDESSDNFLYADDPTLREFTSETLTVEMVEKWCTMRACQIESLTGLVKNALSLISIAKENKIKNLDSLFFDLQTLNDIIQHVEKVEIDLVTLQNMTHFEQSKMLLGTVKRQTFVNNIKTIIIPFGERCERRKCHSKFSILQKLLLELSTNGLDIPFEVFKNLKSLDGREIILKSTDLMKITLDCMYHCPLNNQLNNYYSIFECLPTRESSCSEDEIELHDRIDLLEQHLQICDFLEECRKPITLKYLKEKCNNKQAGIDIMKTVAEYTRTEGLDFDILLENLLTIRQIFTLIDESYCYELAVLSRMCCDCEEKILSADDYLSTFKEEKNKKISFERSIELVLEAAKFHFDNCCGFDDHSLKLAETCLRLINEHNDKLYDELQLIESVYLLNDFGVHILVIQVRTCTNKYTLIDQALKAKPENYKSYQKIMQLANLLQLEDKDQANREGKVLIVLAEHAFALGDFEFCYEMCGRLLKCNYGQSWCIMRKLAECLTYYNNSNKQRLLAFCTMHCPKDTLDEILRTRINQRTPVFS